MQYELEALEFTPDPNKKYILVMRNFKQHASLDHMVKALQGVFPDKSPILLLNEEQTLEVYEVCCLKLRMTRIYFLFGSGVNSRVSISYSI